MNGEPSIASPAGTKALVGPDRHFRTDHLVGSLNKRSVRGGMVTMAGQVAKLALGMGSTAVLARLLAPADFGLVAMVAVFVGFASLFKDLGLSMATVQKADISHEQVSTMFWINVALSMALSLLTVAFAPLVAWFYGKPELLWITMAAGAGFVFAGLSAQHIALLRRQMRFPVLALVEILSLAAGIAAAIALAWAGWGYWALVLMGISQSLATAVLGFFFSGWIPGRPRLTEEVRSMVRFGGNLTGFTALNFLTRNADNLLIGRFAGAAPLGMYAKAYSLLLLPIRQINGPLSSVALPALSRLQVEPEQYRHYYLRVVQAIAYATMPIVVLLGVLSDEVILIFLGPKWIEAAALFRVFAFFAFWQSVSATTGWVLISLGRSRRLFKWGAVQSVVAIVAFAAGIPWGAYGVAVAATLQAYVMVIPSMLYAYHDSPVRLRDVLSAIRRPVVLALLLLIVTFAFRSMAHEAEVVMRVAAVLAGALLTVGSALAIWKPIRDDLRGVIRNLRP